MQPVGVVAATMAASALMVAPLAAIDLPPHGPELDTVAALTALGVLGTGVSFVLYYSLIASEGPARASLVAYVAPGFSVIYGVTLLDEPFGLATAAGLVLIVGGSWLAAEGRPPWKRRTATAAGSGGPSRDPASHPRRRAARRRPRCRGRA